MKDDMNAQAVSWFTRLPAPDVTSADRHEFNQWLAADIEHELAYARIEHEWHDVGALGSWARDELGQLSLESRKSHAAVPCHVGHGPGNSSVAFAGSHLVVGYRVSRYPGHDHHHHQDRAAPADTRRRHAAARQHRLHLGSPLYPKRSRGYRQAWRKRIRRRSRRQAAICRTRRCAQRDCRWHPVSPCAVGTLGNG